MKYSIQKFIGFLYISFSINAYSANIQENKWSVHLCAKIDTNAITDVFDGSKAKYSKDYSYLLFTIDANDINYTNDDDRLTIDGHVYIVNDSTLQLKTLTVASMKDGKPTDEVIYFSKESEITSGLFYNSTPGSSNDDKNVVYIGTAGDVYHLKILNPKDKECLSHFPKKY